VEWKDYINGKLPENAIPVGGHTTEGKTIYIGLAHVINGSSEAFIPTNLIPGEKYVNLTLDDKTRITVSDNIKVLCGKGDYLNRVGWIDVRSYWFLDLFASDVYRPVRAGWQVGDFNGVAYNSSLYIGRILNGNFFIGKVYTSNSDNSKNNKAYTPNWYGVVDGGWVAFSALIYFY